MTAGDGERSLLVPLPSLLGRISDLLDDGFGRSALEDGGHHGRRATVATERKSIFHSLQKSLPSKVVIPRELLFGRHRRTHTVLPGRSE